MMRYIASALESSSWPTVLSPRGAPLPEIAIAGRSNVGKSTFINCLANRKKSLAKVSSTPGKTQRLQFFVFDDRCILVDLPGYGYAAVSQDSRQAWSKAIDEYLNTRSSLKLLLLCLDIRRIPTSDDLSFASWARSRSIPLLPVLTKTDMLSPSECDQNEKMIMATLSLDQIQPIRVPESGRKLGTILLKCV